MDRYEIVDIKRENLRKLHDRRIDVSTYEYDAKTVLVEGRLIDDRRTPAHQMDGTHRQPGVMHDLVVRMLVDGLQMAIVEIESEMSTVPHEFCREVEDSLKPVTGMTISAGFTERVKAAVGGPKGCTHLVALLLTMAPVAIQAAFATIGEKPFAPIRLSKPMIKILEDTCWAWRKDGPLMKELDEQVSSLQSADK